MSEEIIRNTEKHMVHIPQGSIHAESKKSFLSEKDSDLNSKERLLQDDSQSLEDHKAHLPDSSLMPDNQAFLSDEHLAQDNLAQFDEGASALHDNIQHVEGSDIHDRMGYESKHNLQDRVATELSSSLDHHHMEYLEEEVNIDQQINLSQSELKTDIVYIESKHSLSDRQEPVLDESISTNHRETIPDDPHDLKDPTLDLPPPDLPTQTSTTEQNQPRINPETPSKLIQNATHSTDEPQGCEPSVEELDADLKRRMATLQKQVDQINEKLDQLA